MAQYAQNTTVTVEKSRMEIERLITKYGADQFMSGFSLAERSAFVTFKLENRFLRFDLTLPEKDEFKRSEGGRARTKDQAEKAWEQACRQLWRALKLAIHAKLEAWECGLYSFDRIFLGDILLPNNMTMADMYEPQIEKAYADGQIPSPIAGLLPAKREILND